jgi:hypothetical protein
MGDFIAGLFVVALCGGVLLLLWKIFAIAIKQIRKNKADERKYHYIFHGFFKHTEGLPLASGVDIEFFYCRDRVIFRKDAQEMSLACDKIMSIDVTSGENLKSQAATGAIAGKYLLGGLGGAVIGAALTASLYFVITYKYESELKFILLAIPSIGGAGVSPYKIVKYFKAHHVRAGQIDL